MSAETVKYDGGTWTSDRPPSENEEMILAGVLGIADNYVGREGPLAALLWKDLRPQVEEWLRDRLRGLDPG